jgi:tetratricopeptide (TPR) repeat protein
MSRPGRRSARGPVWTAVLSALLLPGFLFSQESPAARAQALLNAGKAGEALPILLDLHRSQPSNANLCQQIGIAYTQLQDLAKAEMFYREAVRLNPRFWAARKNRATVLWFLDRKDESEREFLAVSHALPADPVPHLYLGLAAHARREFARAKTEFEKAGTLASANPEVLPAVLETYLAARDLTFPEQVLQRLSGAGGADAAMALRAAALFSQYGYPEQAHRAYSSALEIDPDSEDSYIASAEFASAHQNNDYALDIVARGLRRLSDSPGLLFEEGILKELKGERSLAEKSLARASALKPGWALPLLALGVSQLESGDAEQAAATFQTARRVEPGDFRAHYLYAAALSRQKGSALAGEQAIAALRQALSLNPNDARSHALLGQLQLAAERPDAAAREWQAALKIEPENATALYQLGLLYRKQGKTEQAERLLAAFQTVKAKQRAGEERLVDILRVVPQKPGRPNAQSRPVTPARAPGNGPRP